MSKVHRKMPSSASTSRAIPFGLRGSYIVNVLVSRLELLSLLGLSVQTSNAWNIAISSRGNRVP